jgi:hypothetical protein
MPAVTLDKDFLDSSRSFAAAWPASWLATATMLMTPSPRLTVLLRLRSESDETCVSDQVIGAYA